MHPEVIDWVNRIVSKSPPEWKRVIDFGSYYINGSVKKILGDGYDVTGVDWREGPGVDVVCMAHEFDVMTAPIVTSTEMLEHDPYWSKSVQAMWACVETPGVLILTCAGPTREPHCVETSPEGGYYGNRTEDDILPLLAWGIDLTETESSPENIQIAAWKS